MHVSTQNVLTVDLFDGLMEISSDESGFLKNDKVLKLWSENHFTSEKQTRVLNR